MQNLVLDIDGTICKIDDNEDYCNRKVDQKVKNQIKYYKNKGFKIIFYTSRNMKTYSNNLGEVTAFTVPKIIRWLEKNDIPYDELIVGKPWCGSQGFYVDDKAIRPQEFIDKTYEEVKELLNIK